MTKQKNRRTENLRTKYLPWQTLDNSAHLFPVIAGERMTNTYRISAVLRDTVQPEILQQALDIILPKFPLFDTRLRSGFFWYYLEENGKKAPRVRRENNYPCRFIRPRGNRDYLFRVTCWERRINLEVYHVLTDGMGAMQFLRELVYQYLRLSEPSLRGYNDNSLSLGTSMNLEDSFLRNYRRKAPKTYHVTPCARITGEHLRDRQIGVIHCLMPVEQVRSAAKARGLSINEYLVGVYAWAIYAAGRRDVRGGAIRVAVPINLRSHFDSITTKNFFVMASATFDPEEDGCGFDDAMQAVRDSLRGQMSREHLEEIFSYNVSNQRHPLGRITPLWLKNLAIRAVYRRSALANSTTMTNLGTVTVDPVYAPYIENFHAVLAMSIGQNIKATVCSYNGTLTVTFSSSLRGAIIQRCFCRQLVQDGIDIELQTNGVYYE